MVATILRPRPSDDSVYPRVAVPVDPHTATALFDRFTQADHNARNVENSDVMILLVPDEVEPLVTDRIRIGGVRYSVQNVEPLKPGGSALMYRVHLTGGIPDDGA